MASTEDPVPKYLVDETWRLYRTAKSP